ncbi:MAG: hypothetical protein GWN07_02645, partial [Actinobacteria bacterium]|nr:hypothetical protein [Actinomycetota bacterium]
MRETVLGVLRHRAALDHVVRQVASRPLDRIDPPVLVALRLGAYELLYLDRVPDFAAVDQAVELVKPTSPTSPARPTGRSRRSAPLGPATRGTRDRHAGAAGFVNGVLRRIANEGRDLLPAPPEPGDVAALATYRSHPRWWVARL